MTRYIFTIFLLVITFIASNIWADGYGPGHIVDRHEDFEAVIKALGIITFLCLVTTLTLGRFQHRNRKALFPWHKRMAFVTLISALTHVSMIIFFH